MNRLSSVRRALDGEGLRQVEVREDRGSVVLEGEVASWELRVNAGFAAAGQGFKGVVNDISVPGVEPERPAPHPLQDGSLEGARFDVAIIGGGIVGASVARELTRHDLSVVVLEKEADVAMHASGRNDGVIHDGFAAKPGSLKARLNVLGNRLWTEDARELGIDLRRSGALALFSSPFSHLLRPFIARRARINGVDGWDFWSREKVAREEPHLTAEQYGAFFMPGTGVLSPYKAVVAYAENAAQNGARFSLNTQVTGFELEPGGPQGRRIARVRTNRGSFFARVVVNAAGIWADVVAGFADDRFFSLHPRRGTDAILDVSTGQHLGRIVSMPSFLKRTRTKGGGLIRTVEGNVLVGPTARELPGRECYATERSEIDELQHHLRLNPKLSNAQIITYFAGVRPCTWEEDFVVERSERVGNLVHAAGIQSPGLASAPAIAREVSALCVAALRETGAVRPNPRFDPRRRPPAALASLSLEERSARIAQNPAYGRVVCRCEQISEGEIVDALHAPVPCDTLDGIKRRTRCGMGRCHGGFCTPHAMEILARERGIPLEQVTKKGEGSRLVLSPEELPSQAPTAEPPATNAIDPETEGPSESDSTPRRKAQS